MCEEISQHEVILNVMKFSEESYKSIQGLKSRVDGVGTCLRFLLERMNNNIVEGRIMTASNDFTRFEIRLIRYVIV